ncbi:hypothetical protein SAMN05518855_100192 [Paenibacillus sp. CF384]|nr:hypothetical protein SAMN05518855_100192 [Paenibacillus sp. CF384]
MLQILLYFPIFTNLSYHQGFVQVNREKQNPQSLYSLTFTFSLTRTLYY